jgi:transcriptional regulator with XRE-family HTH domain
MQNLTAGESLRVLMKREGVKQVELAKKLDLDKRTVSHTIKLFDDNRGTIKTLMEYAEALGFEVEIGFRKKEEK